MADVLDTKILKKLQEDCTMSLDLLSESVGLSPTSCYRRIKKMETQGLIKAKRAILDERKLGFQVTAMFMIKLQRDSSDVDRRMHKILEKRPEIQQCHLISGDFDFVLLAKFRDAAEYTDYIYRFLEIYADIPIRNYSSSIVVRTIRQNEILPL
ncbi:Lrp/AsnC family transcriptional regulator [Sinorhizobium meliloti]|uniref:AsnC family transcriptional regulator n=1 Tax=Rhizobium meliloti TaxID=382 RepID=A0A2J0YWV8_RHIML|nr:Lrp/AsnC family transcriptional regulator [Sinorhizobium meliloti]PJR12765.1 AsnC family transcriptional regulator [Sinorhizobium meliloti]